MSPLGWTVGIELELMAPPGRTRRDLAELLAGDDGQVLPFFHEQSEPSLVEGMSIFDSLTLGFRAVSGDGTEIARCVDDLTLRDRLDPTARPQPGWYRIVSDERRLLEIVRQTADPEGSMADAIAPIAGLYGTTPTPGPGGMLRVADHIGAPICIAAPVPGERERPCEVVTPPIAGTEDLHARLTRLLGAARSLGFYVPTEAATHVHLEAAPLESAVAFANLVELLTTWGAALKSLVRSNPRCVRLGAWPPALLQTVRAPDFRGLDWGPARARIAGLKLSKYADYNVKNMAHPRPDKPTFEVRIMPGAIVAQPVADWAALFVAVAQRCRQETVIPAEPNQSAQGLLAELQERGLLAGEVRRRLTAA